MWIAALTLSSCLLAPSPKQAPTQLVRVILTEADGDPEALISCEQGLLIEEISGLNYAVPAKTNVEFKASKEGIRWKDRIFKGNSIQLVPERNGWIRLGKRSYRGRIQVQKIDNNSLRLINEVDIEDYLRGVLPGELPGDALPESMAAQAVAARTYALAEMSRNKTLFDSVASQVYLGKGGETVKADEAVAKTKGMVLTYNNQVFFTYFHSTCGGHTGDPLLILGEATSPPLRGVACGFCSEKNSKYFSWSALVPKQALHAVVSGQKLGYQLSSIAAGKKDAWGRWLGVRMTGNQNEMEMRGDLFRASLNSKLTPPINLRSLKINHLSEEGDSYRFEGNGWGHGVGMCQIGAMEMARLGYSFPKILSHYYPDSKLEDWRQLKN